MTVWANAGPVLKITYDVLTGYEHSLLYLIRQPLTSSGFETVVVLPAGAMSSLEWERGRQRTLRKV